MNELHKAAQDLLHAHQHTTPGMWRKGLTTHHTVTDLPQGGVYGIGEFKHADDANFVDIAHEVAPLLARVVLGELVPCSKCGHPFDQKKLGPLGCPNCHGEGLEVQPADIETSGRVVIKSLQPGMATLAAGAADTERLDFLAQHPERITHVGMVWYSRTGYSGPMKRHENIRQAIDHARSSGK